MGTKIADAEREAAKMATRFKRTAKLMEGFFSDVEEMIAFVRVSVFEEITGYVMAVEDSEKLVKVVEILSRNGWKRSRIDSMGMKMVSGDGNFSLSILCREATWLENLTKL